MKRWRNSRYWVRMGLIAGYLLLMALLMPRTLRLNLNHEVGKSWQRDDLYAPFDFAMYKSQDTVQAERDRVLKEIPDIFVQDTSRMRLARERVEQRINTVAENLERWNAFEKSGDTAKLALAARTLEERYGDITDGTWEALRKQLNPSAWQAAASAAIDHIFTTGYTERISLDSSLHYIQIRTAPAEEIYVARNKLLSSPADLQQELESQLSERSAPEQALLLSILQRRLLPNIRYSERLTREARQYRKALVSPVYGKVREGELIIRKGEKVDPETAIKLQSLIIEREKRSGNRSASQTLLGQLLVILLISLLVLGYLGSNQPRIYFNNSKLSLILVIMLLAVAGMIVATKLTDIAAKLVDILGPNINLSYIYLAPACIVPIFITNFFNNKTGFLANLAIALYGAVLIQQELEYVFVQTMAGTVALIGMRHLRKREHFFYTLSYIFLAYSVSYLVYNLLSKGNFGAIDYQTLLLFAINIALTMIAYNLIYLFERMFGITSDLTYLELLDTNHPLLQEMARKCPGTFQHSLQVANIAEATINEVGGNALLTHVGALYHDIGKMSNPQYFIENMSEEEKANSPHNQISCQESADIIIGHVKRGITMAQKYHLPREIVRFIETHHGTTRVEYFYRKYLKENNCESPMGEEHFRYPGPLPFSKETAVLMLSDSIEAASRSLKEPTKEKLKELVNGIIDYKIRDGQLERSNLTFKDITTSRKVITKQLVNIYHGRISYKAEAEKANTPQV